MKLWDLLNTGIDFQGDYKVVYYDYDNDKRIEVDEYDHDDSRVLYMYPEDDTIYIEIENPNE